MEENQDNYASHLHSFLELFYWKNPSATATASLHCIATHSRRYLAALPLPLYRQNKVSQATSQKSPLSAERE